MSEVKEEKKETISIKMKPSIWKEAKKQAIDEEKTVSEVVEAALEKWIKEHKKP